jgi:SAM-dependent methyltransferase
LVIKGRGRLGLIERLGRLGLIERLGRLKRLWKYQIAAELYRYWQENRILNANPNFSTLLSAYRKIYADSAAANLVSWLERQESFRQNIDDLTYGETPFTTWLKLIPLMQLQPHEKFVELGCGTGILSLYLSFSQGVSVTGVDSIEKFILNANQLAMQFQLPAEFRAVSVLDLDLGEFQVMYCVATCFNEETRTALTDKMGECLPGTRILVVTHELEHPRLKKQSEWSLPFSWGRDTVYLYVAQPEI